MMEKKTNLDRFLTFAFILISLIFFLSLFSLYTLNSKEAAVLRSVGMRGAFAEGERGSVEAERNVNKIATLSIGSIEFAMTVGKITLLTSILSLISVILMQNIIKKGNIVWRENPKNTL